MESTFIRMKGLLVLFILTLFACNLDKIEQSLGVIQEPHFQSERFGWSMNLSEDWRLLTKLEEKLYKKIGDKALERAAGEKQMDTWTEILSIQHGMKKNILMVVCSKYDPELHGPSYQYAKDGRFNSMRRAIEKNPGMQVEGIRTITTIDEVAFDTYHLTVARNGNFLFKQSLLEKKFGNDELLMISIIAEDLEKFQEFQDSLQHSKFNRKD